MEFETQEHWNLQQLPHQLTHILKTGTNSRQQVIHVFPDAVKALFTSDL